MHKLPIVLSTALLLLGAAAPATAQSSWGDWLDGLSECTATPPQRFLGISLVSPRGAMTPLARLERAPRRLVLLVHGLNEPGWVWNDLLPALQESDRPVARFEYGPEASIADAADRLAAQLTEARRRGVERVDVVAHSMGGLICRDVLTRPAYYDGDGSLSDRYPAVDRLIMVGTPNHGTQAARLRRILAFRGELMRTLPGATATIDEVSDGGGAAFDLLPGSDYLRRLNRRSRPTHTRYTIIAGRWIPVTDRDLERLASSWGDPCERAPRWLQALAGTVAGTDAGRPRGLTRSLRNIVKGIGDGLVPIESARLEGVDDFVVVAANHQSMIHNLVPSSRTPPAIPVILDRLQEGPW